MSPGRIRADHERSSDAVQRHRVELWGLFPSLTARAATGISDCMQRRIAIFVIFLVVVHVIAATNAGHPCGVGAIPVDRLTEAVFQRDLWFPTEFALGLIALQRIAPVVAWAILHV